MDAASTNLAISQLSQAHHGLVRHDLALTAGISASALERRRRNHFLEPVGPGISRLAGAPETWRQRALIAAWLAGPRAIVSHRAAAMLWRLDGIDAGPLEVLTDRWARRCRLDNVKLHEASDITSADRTEVDGIPCASVVRVLLDLPSAVHHFRADQAFENALRRQLCTVDQLADRFVQIARRGRPGTVIGRRLIQKRLAGYVPTHSEFERRVSDLAEAAGLPRPVHQHPVVLPNGRTVYIDLAYPDRMVAIECDGLFYHADNLRLPWDDDRQNELVLLGWLVLRITWEQLTRQPEVVTRQLVIAFRRHQHNLR